MSHNNVQLNNFTSNNSEPTPPRKDSYNTQEEEEDSETDVANETKDVEEKRKQEFINKLKQSAGGVNGFISKFLLQVASELQYVIEKHILRGKDVISVGSGDGILEKYIASLGVNVTCVDPRCPSSQTYHQNIVMHPEYNYITDISLEVCQGATLLLVAPSPNLDPVPQIEYDMQAVCYPKNPWEKIIIIFERTGGSGSTLLQQAINLLDQRDYSWEFGMDGSTPEEKYQQNWRKYENVAHQVAEKYRLVYIFERDCGAYVYSIVVMEPQGGPDSVTLEKKYVKRKQEREQNKCVLM